VIDTVCPHLSAAIDAWDIRGRWGKSGEEARVKWLRPGAVDDRLDRFGRCVECGRAHPVAERGAP
jgi:hypothetical protein